MVEKKCALKWKDICHRYNKWKQTTNHPSILVYISILRLGLSSSGWLFSLYLYSRSLDYYKVVILYLIARYLEIQIVYHFESFTFFFFYPYPWSWSLPTFVVMITKNKQTNTKKKISNKTKWMELKWNERKARFLIVSLILYTSISVCAIAVIMMIIVKVNILTICASGWKKKSMKVSHE